jgi:hypothetical protein
VQAESDPAGLLISAGYWIPARGTVPALAHADFLAKPFAIDELLALVVRLTSSP